MKKRLLFLAAFAAAILLLASCEQAGGVSTSDEDTSSSPACGKSDGPGCLVALPGEDTVSSQDTDDLSDTTPPDEPKPAVNYDGVYCPNKGCTLVPTSIEMEDAWDRWDCVPEVTTGMKTAGIPQLCGL